MSGRYAVKVRTGARHWKMQREGLLYMKALEVARLAIFEDGYPAAKVLFRRDDGTWELVKNWRAPA